MLGVLMLAGVITFGAVKLYQSARDRQSRFIAEHELKELAENIKILYSGRHNYTGISTDYLIKAGALKTEKIAGQPFRVQSSFDGKSFSIVFNDMNHGDCVYFATKKFEWADGVAVNGMTGHASAYCAETHPNKLELTAR